MKIIRKVGTSTNSNRIIKFIKLLLKILRIFLRSHEIDKLQDS